jgi:hypothetical protein
VVQIHKCLHLKERQINCNLVVFGHCPYM